jgi:hypothetical protein
MFRVVIAILVYHPHKPAEMLWVSSKDFVKLIEQIVSVSLPRRVHARFRRN